MFNGIVDSDVALSQGRSSVSSAGSARPSRSADAARIAQCEEEVRRANEKVQKYEAEMAQMSATQQSMQRFLQVKYHECQLHGAYDEMRI